MCRGGRTPWDITEGVVVGVRDYAGGGSPYFGGAVKDISYLFGGCSGCSGGGWSGGFDA